MDAGNPILTHWYFHLPNYLLAALMYTMLGRLVLSLFVSPDSRNYIYRAFVRLTDPLLAPVGWITPRVVPAPVLMVFAFLWLAVIRVVLIVAFLKANAAPAVA